MDDFIIIQNIFFNTTELKIISILLRKFIQFVVSASKFGAESATTQRQICLHRAILYNFFDFLFPHFHFQCIIMNHIVLWIIKYGIVEVSKHWAKARSKKHACESEKRTAHVNTPSPSPDTHAHWAIEKNAFIVLHCSLVIVNCNMLYVAAFDMLCTYGHL